VLANNTPNGVSVFDVCLRYGNVFLPHSKAAMTYSCDDFTPEEEEPFVDTPCFENFNPVVE
jgi:hypothetical protein